MPVKSKELVDSPEVEPAKEEEVSTTDYEIRMPDGRSLYTTNQEELDNAFYEILALASWSKTFVINPKLSLTFTTINDTEKMENLERIRVWAEKNNVSNQMFDQYVAKINLAYYLSTIEIGGSVINLRSLTMEKRIEHLSAMAEQAISYYGLYHNTFVEVIRRALLSNSTLKN